MKTITVVAIEDVLSEDAREDLLFSIIGNSGSARDAFNSLDIALLARDTAISYFEDEIERVEEEEDEEDDILIEDYRSSINKLNSLSEDTYLQM